MQKVIRDGLVAILYSPGHGAGWSTWGVPVEGVFHPKLVNAVESGASAETIEGIAFNLFGDDYYGGAGQLKIMWLSVGTQFEIDEYDGYESVITNEDVHWIVA